MKRIHFAPATAADYVDAALTDATDALAFAESIDPRDSFDFFGRTAAPVTRARRAPVRITAALAYTVAATAAAVMVLAPAAHAVQLESADRHVSAVRVTYVEPIGARKLYVELNNGAAYRLNPCRVEDGRQCYWDAGDMGNGAGSSFVRVAGRYVYSAMVGGAR